MDGESTSYREAALDVDVEYGVRLKAVTLAGSIMTPESMMQRATPLPGGSKLYLR